MVTQRGLPAENSAGSRSWVTRRAFVAALGTAVAATPVSGCLTGLGGVAPEGTTPVSVLAAGSLQRSFGEGLRESVTVPLRVEAHGSVTGARLVADGKRDPDVVALADTTLFETILEAPWYAEFATNELTVAFADSPGGEHVAGASPWFDPFLRDRATIGRSDPDLDPLGYRTHFAVALSEDHYDRPHLSERILDPAQIYPETSLLSRLESGAIDAAVVYRNMAIERGYDSIDLPAAVDLGDPALARHYETVGYELPDGSVVNGAPISFGAWARTNSDRVTDVYRSLIDGAYLTDHGLGAPDGYPRYRGSVPDDFRVDR